MRTRKDVFPPDLQPGPRDSDTPEIIKEKGRVISTHHQLMEKSGSLTRTVFRYKVETTDKSCLQRQVREGANLAAREVMPTTSLAAERSTTNARDHQGEGRSRLHPPPADGEVEV